MDLTTLRYAETHEWVQFQGELCTVGITDFAVAELTDLVYVELPEPGSDVKAGEACGEVESVKAVSELISPVDGVVAEVNETLEAQLEKLSTSPFEEGWLYRVKVSDPAQLENLMDRTAYQEFCSSEAH